MSDIKDWFIAPLLEAEQRIHKESGTRPRIEITVHGSLFADLAKLIDGARVVARKQDASPFRPLNESPRLELHIGHNIIVRPWAK
jgi:hypothetical protein